MLSHGSIAMLLAPWTFHPELHILLTYAGGIQIMICILSLSRQPHHEPWTCTYLEHEHAIAIGSAIDLSSSSAYSLALNSYITFCQAHHFPIDPTPETLSFYTVYMCHHIKPKSVDSYLSGICNQPEPFFPNIHSDHHHSLVTRTLKGCKKLVPNLCFLQTPSDKTRAWSSAPPVL